MYSTVSKKELAKIVSFRCEIRFYARRGCVPNIRKKKKLCHNFYDSYFFFFFIIRNNLLWIAFFIIMVSTFSILCIPVQPYSDLYDTLLLYIYSINE